MLTAAINSMTGIFPVQLYSKTRAWVFQSVQRHVVIATRRTWWHAPRQGGSYIMPAHLPPMLIIWNNVVLFDSVGCLCLMYFFVKPITACNALCYIPPEVWNCWLGDRKDMCPVIKHFVPAILRSSLWYLPNLEWSAEMGQLNSDQQQCIVMPPPPNRKTKIGTEVAPVTRDSAPLSRSKVKVTRLLYSPRP